MKLNIMGPSLTIGGTKQPGSYRVFLFFIFLSF